MLAVGHMLGSWATRGVQQGWGTQTDWSGAGQWDITTALCTGQWVAALLQALQAAPAAPEQPDRRQTPRHTVYVSLKVRHWAQATTESITAAITPLWTAASRCQYLVEEEELSRLRVLRWNKEGARQTAMLVGVIWFSSTKATTSRRKNRRIFRASRFSFGRRRIAAWTAWNCWSFGTSENMNRDKNHTWLTEGASISRVPSRALVGSSISLSQAHSRQGKAIIPSNTNHFSYYLSSACSHPGMLLPDLQFILNSMLMNISWTELQSK